LLALNLAGKEWADWEKNLPIDDGLPDDTDLCEFMSVEIPELPHLLQGLFRKGQVMSVCGASKTYKSWTAMEIALSLSQGGRFAKWQANV
jgi:RecA-family ATPase